MTAALPSVKSSASVTDVGPGAGVRRAWPARLLAVLALVLSVALVGGGTAGAEPSGSSSAPSDGTTVELSPGSTSPYDGQDEPPADQRVTWAVEPSTADGPDGRVSFRYELDGGAVVDDFVTVSNYGQSDVTFRLYASDGITTEEGVFDLRPGAETPTDSGSWIQLAQNEITVPARSRATVPFRITVPATATPGDHPAGVVASLSGAGADGSVNVEQRVGARVHLRVAGELTPRLEVQDLAADYRGGWTLGAGGTSTVGFDVVNTGNVRLSGTATLTVEAPFGVWDRTVELGQVPEILPGNRVHLTATVDGVPPLLVLSHRVSLTVAAVASDDVGALPGATEATARSAAMPWLWIVILIIAVAVVTILVQRRSRNRRVLAEAVAKARAEGREEARQAEAVGEEVGAVGEEVGGGGGTTADEPGPRRRGGDHR
ncbi:COG1470 family protein [Nakamurella leprariae]|uniref:DUF916 domain-containing protein n=1 Tax=Nakamurella leprariae TaxID=2803911 RepID=A0A938YJM0_9ACTN|nr:DUF916 domain-containing protein [Nakamurella leprariae]MBM9469364.1 DUF916 domain-containing protein [Nakamurella leprariae]